MNTLMLTAAVGAQNLNLDTGIPVYILVPVIMAIAIVSVIVIRWIYNKSNKK